MVQNQYPYSELSEYIDLVVMGATKYGLRNLKRLLFAFTLNHNHTDKELLSFILSETLSSFQISYDEMVKMDSKGDICDARRIFICLVKKYMKLSYYQLALLIQRTPQQTHNYFKEFNGYNYKNPQHKHIIDIFRQIDNRTQQFKNNLSLSNGTED